ncbi:MAG: hypothetical protein V4696_02975 [Pseudomonadota bacterium]
MIDFQPYLSGCDQALAEADLLLASLVNSPLSLTADVTAVRQRIAILRREVERLRGMSAPPIRERIKPNWIEISGADSLWPKAGRDLAGEA